MDRHTKKENCITAASVSFAYETNILHYPLLQYITFIAITAEPVPILISGFFLCHSNHSLGYMLLRLPSLLQLSVKQELE